MNYFRRSWVLLVLFGAVIGRAATDDKQHPDREMLRMMDVLREMEMLKQMEILRDRHAVESLTDNGVRNTHSSKPPAARKKEAVK
jgi:hypothetical protein